MRYRIFEAQQRHRGSAVAATDDRYGIAVGNRLSHCFGSRCKWLHFEHAHRPIPNHRLRARDHLCKFFARLWTDIIAFPAVWNFTRRDDLFVTVCIERIAAMIIHWQNDFVSSFLQQRLCQINFVFFNQAIANRAALSQRKRIRHRTTDDDVVTDADQIFDDFNFVGNLGTTKNRDERSLRIRNHAVQIFDFFRNQRTNHLGLVAHRFSNSVHRSVFAMTRTKGIVAIDVRKTSQHCREIFATTFLGGIKSQIFQN